jgi:hypothetical protein
VSTGVGDIEELLAGWRTLSEWERDPYRDHRTWNKLVDRCNRLAERLVADPVGVEELRRIAAEDPDRSVRLNARQFTTPYVPRPDSKRDLDRWMSHPLIDIASLGVQPRVGFGLTPGDGFEIDPDVNLSEIDLSWFGGEPVTDGDRDWPRRPDGTPLAHLLQVELGGQPLLDDDLHLDGVLQFFHDLDGFGQVRLLTEPPTGLLPRPADAPHRERRRAHVHPVWTFPEAGDLELTPDEAERLHAANRRVHETLYNEWGLYEMTDPAPEFPLMLGWAGLLRLPGEPAVEFVSSRPGC